MAQRILLCDDEVHILRAAEFKLQRAGYDIECAGDGEQGWEAIQRRLPDLLVTDCQMPRLDGLRLVERIRADETTRNLPVIMLTAKGFELTEKALAEKWGICRLLSKPFSPRELARHVEEIVGPPAVLAGVSE
jgi:DNA-binding response OmpR family regulator